MEGVAPEWDPYDKNDGDNADSDGSGLERSGRGTAMGGVGRRRRGVAAGEGRRRGSSGSSRGGDVDVGSGVMGPGAVTLDSMSEARVRFLTAVKAHCTERYRQGWLSSTGLRVLKVGYGGGYRGGTGGGWRGEATICHNQLYVMTHIIFPS